jgi:hypothetical protein
VAVDHLLAPLLLALPLSAEAAAVLPQLAAALPPHTLQAVLVEPLLRMCALPRAGPLAARLSSSGSDGGGAPGDALPAAAAPGSRPAGSEPAAAQPMHQPAQLPEPADPDCLQQVSHALAALLTLLPALPAAPSSSPSRHSSGAQALAAGPAAGAGSGEAAARLLVLLPQQSVDLLLQLLLQPGHFHVDAGALHLAAQVLLTCCQLSSAPNLELAGLLGSLLPLLAAPQQLQQLYGTWHTPRSSCSPAAAPAGAAAASAADSASGFWHLVHLLYTTFSAHLGPEVLHARLPGWQQLERQLQQRHGWCAPPAAVSPRTAVAGQASSQRQFSQLVQQVLQQRREAQQFRSASRFLEGWGWSAPRSPAGGPARLQGQGSVGGGGGGGGGARRSLQGELPAGGGGEAEGGLRLRPRGTSSGSGGGSRDDGGVGARSSGGGSAAALR